MRSEFPRSSCHFQQGISCLGWRGIPRINLSFLSRAPDSWQRITNDDSITCHLIRWTTLRSAQRISSVLTLGSKPRAGAKEMPEQGKVYSERLDDWSQLLDEWIRVVDAYAHAVPGDVPYCYSERTSVGLLAAAVWRTGGVALQDYSYIPSKSWSSVSTEWGDLCAVMNAHVFLIESKVDWYHESASITEFWKRFNAAKEEAERKIQVPNGAAFLESCTRRVAVVFSSPQTPIRDGGSGFETKLGALRGLFESREIDALAWSRPYDDPASFKFEPGQESWYPGVILTAAEISSGIDSRG